MAAGAAGFEMGFIIGLNGVAFGAFFADPLLLVAVFSPEMFFDSDEIAEGVAGVVVEAARLRADENTLSGHRSFALQQFPGHLVAPPVHLQILISLEPLIADLTHVSIRFQQGFGGKRHHFRIWIYINRLP